MSDNNTPNKKHSLLSVLNPFEVFSHHETATPKKERRLKFTTSRSIEALIFLVI